MKNVRSSTSSTVVLLPQRSARNYRADLTKFPRDDAQQISQQKAFEEATLNAAREMEAEEAAKKAAKKARWDRFVRRSGYVAGGLVAAAIVVFVYYSIAEKTDPDVLDAMELTEFVPGQIWTYRHHYQPRDGNLPVAMSHNMAIVKLSSSSGTKRPELLVYNPVELNPTIYDMLNELGEVKHIVIPNLRSKFFDEYIIRYPDAHFYCPLSCRAKFARKYRKLMDQGRLHALPSDGSIPVQWRSSGDFAHMTFTGIPTLNEVVLLHRPSKTLLAAEMMQNFDRPGIIRCNNPDTKPAYVQLMEFLKATGRVAINPLLLIDIDNTSTLKSEVDHVAEWDWQGAVMECGEPMKPDGQESVRDIRQEWKESVYGAGKL